MEECVKTNPHVELANVLCLCPINQYLGDITDEFATLSLNIKENSTGSAIRLPRPRSEQLFGSEVLLDEVKDGAEAEPVEVGGRGRGKERSWMGEDGS
ncbi:hypothetical protein DY000_02018471 [Brassica cretica]|uniref:Uncharacterized protein n=1 Tax=Brassica cretica TaxID=69181 RepID=A0ABQ7D414_BRACR|nr:hypothetical protein DY000_02018471 [Brassica cretica]